MQKELEENGEVELEYSDLLEISLMYVPGLVHQLTGLLIDYYFSNKELINQEVPLADVIPLKKLKLND